LLAVFGCRTASELAGYAKSLPNLLRECDDVANFRP
jgi:hypothetical protein